MLQLYDHVRIALTDLTGDIVKIENNNSYFTIYTVKIEDNYYTLPSQALIKL